MEEDDDEDRERGKHPSNGHNTNNANRGGGSSANRIDSNRQQPKNKPKNYDGIPKNNVGNAEDEDEKERCKALPGSRKRIDQAGSGV